MGNNALYEGVGAKRLYEPQIYNGQNPNEGE